jgi:error-prone DNA polymerase
LRYVKGLGSAAGQSILAARAERPFSSVEDLADRTGLEARELGQLAEAGALEALEGSRRGAWWRARGRSGGRPAAPGLALRETVPEFPALDALEGVCWDYRTTGHSPRGHPLAALREELRARGLPDAHAVSAMPDGRRVRYAGLVICRQRPGTASGVVFMTLEDESGFVNLVVWSRVFERHAVLVRTESFLGVSGRLQVRDGVTHVVAETFWRPDLRRSPAVGESHDFH